MKKKIWIINHYASDMLDQKGGRHYWFAKYLKRMGYEPIIFCSNALHNTKAEKVFDNDNLWNEKNAEEINVPFVFVKTREYTGNGKQRILNMIDFYMNVRKVAKEYASINGTPDVIYASSAHPLTVVAGIKLAKHFGVKCICEVRDLWPESIVAYGIAGPHNPAVVALRILEKWMYMKSAAVVFTMENAYAYIDEQGWSNDIPRSKVFYINNGVDLEAFEYNKAHYITHDEDIDNPDIFKVVYAGSIRKANNVGLLVDAAKIIEDKKVKVLIWGSGEELENLKKRVTEEKIGNVVFKGRVAKDYIPSIISRSNLNFIDPFDEKISKYGISSNKMFEYFAAERPILVSRMNHCPMQNSGCIVFYETTPEGIAEGIERVSNMARNKYNAACSSAKEGADKYNFKALTDKLVKVIEETK